MSAVDTFLEQRRLDPSGTFERSLDLADRLGSFPVARLGGIAIIPVATHQDGWRVEHTLDRYGEQELSAHGANAVLLGTNHPIGTPKEQVEAVEAQAEEARQKFPDLQIGHVDIGELPNTARIGEIRQYLWDAVLIILQREGADPNKLVMFNHDIDLITMSVDLMRHHIEKHAIRAGLVLSNDHYHNTEGLPPRLAEVIKIIDLTSNALVSAMSGTLSQTAENYAANKGFSTQEEINETSTFNMHTEKVNGVAMTTSERRMIMALGKGHVNPWHVRTFGLSDEYRTITGTTQDLDDKTYRKLLTAVPFLIRRRLRFKLTGLRDAYLGKTTGDGDRIAFEAGVSMCIELGNALVQQVCPQEPDLITETVKAWRLSNSV